MGWCDAADAMLLEHRCAEEQRASLDLVDDWCAVGGGCQLVDRVAGLVAELAALVDPETRGDPMSALVWTTKSTRNLAGELTKRGHRVSDRTVARMLREMGFSLQGIAKVVEGAQHEDAGHFVGPGGDQ